MGETIKANEASAESPNRAERRDAEPAVMTKPSVVERATPRARAMSMKRAGLANFVVGQQLKMSAIAKVPRRQSRFIRTSPNLFAAQVWCAPGPATRMVEAGICSPDGAQRNPGTIFALERRSRI